MTSGRVAAALLGATAVLVLPGAGTAQPAEDPPAVPAAAPVADHPRVAQALELLDAWLDAEVAYEEIPGASAAVVHGHDLMWTGAYGWAHPERRAPATPETLYSICSISKLFTSVAAMRLWEEGRLELSDPVAEHLPWFDLRDVHEGDLPITIQALMTHSSGLPRESDFPYWSAPDFDFPSRQEIVDRLSEQETLYPAETYFQYSNLGLTLLGEVVAAASGRPFEEYVRAEVLAPLGLEDTRPDIPVVEEGGRLATGHSATTREGVREPVPLFRAEGIAAAAGFASTVLDLGRFAAWQFRLLGDGAGGEAAPTEAGDAAAGDATAAGSAAGAAGREVLRPATLRKMHRVHWVDPDWDVHWGLGFAVWRDGEKTYVGHGGSCPGFRSHLSLQPEGELAVAVAANASGVDVNGFTRNAHRILGPAVAAAAGDSAGAAEPPDPELEAYTGLYSVHPWGGEVAVLAWDDGLAMVDLPSRDPMESLDELERVEGDVFRRVRDDGEPGETVEFERDDAGEVVAFVRFSNRYPKVR